MSLTRTVPTRRYDHLYGLIFQLAKFFNYLFIIIINFETFADPVYTIAANRDYNRMTANATAAAVVGLFRDIGYLRMCVKMLYPFNLSI